MFSDEALNALLDQLASVHRREEQLALLRTWIASALQAREEQRELLGKLGGG